MADGSRVLSIEAIVARFGVVAIALGAGLEGETAVVTGGILAHQGLVAWPAAVLAAAIGSFIADQIFFTIGRRARDGRWVGKLRKRRVYARVMGMMERYPVGFIFAFRFLYGFRTISPVAIGTTRVSARLFVLVNGVSAIVWGVVFTGVGYLFGHGFEKAIERLLPDRHAILILAAGGVALAALVGGWHWWRTRTRADA